MPCAASGQSLPGGCAGDRQPGKAAPTSQGLSLLGVRTVLPHASHHVCKVPAEFEISFAPEDALGFLLPFLGLSCAPLLWCLVPFPTGSREHGDGNYLSQSSAPHKPRVLESVGKGEADILLGHGGRFHFGWAPCSWILHRQDTHYSKNTIPQRELGAPETDLST